MLWGEVNGVAIHMRVVSGGGGGTTSLKGPDEPGTVNNPLHTWQKANHKNHVRGGPLPGGNYRIHTPSQHPRLGKSAYLEPLDPERMGNRAGFFIHGRGKHGSDGCIVPVNPTEFQHLMAGLTKDQGGRLTVVMICDFIAGAPSMAS